MSRAPIGTPMLTGPAHHADRYAARCQTQESFVNRTGGGHDRRHQALLLRRGGDRRGGSGLLAVIEARLRGKKTAVISKSLGEMSGGMHGSNRQGGNSLSDLLVFGRRVGAGAADCLDTMGTRAPVPDAALAGPRAEALTPLQQDGGENPYAVHAEARSSR